ncbi:hypothetical protein SDRG_01400 [Saprolegnia diclina VS20]|uniref:THIF-type NAD/FAD binding fold domain-containing protein n=1 Tax=Saprolegnia diclina (strain VS20) TaxID=1156394 RepID=T0SES9_SAPDV|nr:hypothetical protein SDRG_01400 [Saprolegnia diclina VS20]EQC41432.1 hypothetical protein SDRG_01400 [Saprolegnia diclina VS20]|eukprot:XP_008605146.1 hypothetical protein SDRG_01400 [Saprolegnia diclina VS20]
MADDKDDELHRRVAQRVDRIKVAVDELTNAVRVLSSADHPQRPPRSTVPDPIDEREGSYSRILANNDRGVIKEIESLGSMAIIIVGLNGMGCAIAETFCRSGIGKIYLVDDDPRQVQAEDLSQLFYLPQNVGYERIAEVETNLRLIDESVDIEGVRLDAKNAGEWHAWGGTHPRPSTHALRMAFLAVTDTAIIRNVNEICLELNVPLIAIKPGNDGLSGHIVTSIRSETPCLLCYKAPGVTAPRTSDVHIRSRSMPPVLVAPVQPMPMMEGILAGFAGHAALKRLLGFGTFASCMNYRNLMEEATPTFETDASVFCVSRLCRKFNSNLRPETSPAKSMPTI